jgi:hypothetical protein
VAGGPFVKVLGRVDELCVKSWFHPELEDNLAPSIITTTSNPATTPFYALLYPIKLLLEYSNPFFFPVKEIHQILVQTVR